MCRLFYRSCFTSVGFMKTKCVSVCNLIKQCSWLASLLLYLNISMMEPVDQHPFYIGVIVCSLCVSNVIVTLTVYHWEANPVAYVALAGFQSHCLNERKKQRPTHKK